MGGIVQGLIGKGGTTFGKGGLFNPDDRQPKLPPPPAPVAPPATADTTQAQEQARKRVPTGRAETFLTGDLIPSEEELRGKRRFLGGSR